MSKNVAAAFSTANQNSAGLYLLFMFQKERPLRFARAAVAGKQKNYFISNVKFCAAPVSLTSISAVCTPSLRCVASSVYLPGGTSLMVNFPSAPLTEKYG